MSEYIFEYKQSDNEYLIEIKIIRVKIDEDFHEGVKYSLVVIDKKTKKRVLGFDNELTYEFKDEWKLIEDFHREYENIKRRLPK